MKQIFFALALLFAVSPAFSQIKGSKKDPVPQKTETAEEEKPKIKWLTIEEAAEKMKTEKRKIFVDVYTDWCGWCKRMDAESFADKRVAKYINQNFYAVKFDAEYRKDIVFNGKTYKFKEVGSRGYHELASEWLNGRLSYPTTVYLDEEQSTIQSLPGYLDAEKLEMILTYFGSNSHKKTPWETYEKNFVNYRKQ